MPVFISPQADSSTLPRVDYAHCKPPGTMYVYYQAPMIDDVVSTHQIIGHTDNYRRIIEDSIASGWRYGVDVLGSGPTQDSVVGLLFTSDQTALAELRKNDQLLQEVYQSLFGDIRDRILSDTGLNLSQTSVNVTRLSFTSFLQGIRYFADLLEEKREAVLLSKGQN